MKKWQVIAVAITCILVAVLFVVFFIYSRNSSDSPIGKKSLGQGLQEDQTPASPCLGMQERLVNNFFGGGGKLTARSHLNTKLGKCFVEIDQQTEKVDYLQTLWEAPDSFIALCAAPTVAGRRFAGEGPGCYTNHGQKISKEQFDALRNQYMTE